MSFPHVRRAMHRAAFAMLVMPGLAVAADGAEPALLLPPASARLTAPLVLSAAPGAHPTWTHRGLFTVPPGGLFALAQAANPGIPAWDPSSRAWYAAVQGALVRVEPDGRLPVILDNVQGRDVDVRFAAGRAVSREPDDTIVSWQWRGSETARHVLLAGPQYFHPRLSPDGTHVVVAASAAGGGHLWLVGPDHVPVDLGRGEAPSWTPAGDGILFTQVEHDGHRVTASSLWRLELATRRAARLAYSRNPVISKPVLSPDGAWLAFVDAASGDVQVVSWPLAATDGR